MPPQCINILLTGTAGFIGSNFVPYFLDKNKNYNLINLDLLTYAGTLDNLKEVERSPRYKFIKGDICNRELIEFIFTEYDIRGVINFAAESHVDNSIKNPDVFVRTNINGTHALIEVAYKYWMEAPFSYKKERLINNKNNLQKYNTPRFHHISTDEVYGALGETGLFTELTPYAPNSPYSASKAASDMLVRAYHHTYGMNTIITNCSNNYGPKQHDEKFIPTIIRKAIANQRIPIYGDGQNIRDWLYVTDHCSGIDIAYHNGKAGEFYNIGGGNEKSNNQIVKKICEILDDIYPIRKNNAFKYNEASPQDIKKLSYKHLIHHVEDRAGHDRRYAIDATKIEKELGWKADEAFERGIVKTIEWYVKKYKQGAIDKVK